MNVRKKFGNAVLLHRKNMGMSQEDLAGSADLDRTYVSGIERGLRNPTLEVMLVLAASLQTTVSELTQDL